MSVDPTQALQGVRVVELASGMAGEVAGLILAQYGADVLKVEPLGGVRSAQWDGFQLWNAGKRRRAVDLKGADGAGQFRRLVADADVLLRALSPSTVRALEVGPAELTQINPRLIDVDITGFDPDTPYADLPGWDGLIAAKMGRGSVFRGPGRAARAGVSRRAGRRVRSGSGRCSGDSRCVAPSRAGRGRRSAAYQPRARYVPV